MPFWLKKLAALPFLPLPFVLLTAITGLVLLLFTKRRKTALAALLTSVLALALFSNQGISRLLLSPLERHYPALPDASPGTPYPDAITSCSHIVVLGGGHANSPQLPLLSQLSSSALARLAEGVRLSQALPNARLVFAGYNGKNELSHARTLALAARSLGVPESRMICLDAPRDTEEEIQALLREIGPRPFLLVTSAWHMPRAIALCQKNGLKPVAAPADFMDRPGSTTSFTTWDIGSLERSTKAIHEHLGMLWSRLRNRI